MRKNILVALVLLTVSTMTAAGVVDTKHNLSSGGSGPNTFSGTDEVCVFCHTPHGSDTSAKAPLWNRTVGNPTDYTTYNSLGSVTLDGASSLVGSVSLACLSCHDGTQAMDTILNDPGSGAENITFTSGAWTGNDRPQGIANLSQDLSNDHPIGVQYGGGGINVTNITGPTIDSEFILPTSAVINGTRQWWVDTETTGNGTRDKSDMILYTRDIAGIAGGAQPYVECASCHDPHTTNDLFLRISNDNSAVCLACHVK